MKNLVDHSHMLKESNNLGFFNSFIAKILYLTRLISMGTKDVLVYSNNNIINSYLTLAAFMTHKQIFICNDDKTFRNILFHHNISQIFVDVESTNYITIKDKLLSPSNNELDYTLFLIPSMLYKANPFNRERIYREGIVKHNFISFTRLSAMYFSYGDNPSLYTKLNKQEFKSKFSKAAIWDLNDPFLNIYLNEQKLTFTKGNVLAILDTIRSEFDSHTIRTIDFRGVKFEQSWAYILYFLIKGEYVVFDDVRYLMSSRLNRSYISIDSEEVVFLNSDSIKELYNDNIKYFIYSKWMKLYDRFWITKWLYKKLLHRKMLQELNINSKDTLVFVEPLPNYAIIDTLKKSKLKYSIILGTSYDGNCIAINRHDEDLEQDEYRIMANVDQLNFGTTTISQLCIAGERISNSTIKFYPHFSKDNIRYYNTKLFCEIDRDIVKLMATPEEMYHYLDDNGKPMLSMSTYVQRMSLLSEPIIKDVAIIKFKDKFVAIVALDKSFIESSFEEASYLKAQRTINKKIHELNKTLRGCPIIDRVVYNSSYLDELKRSNLSIATISTLLDQ